MTLVATTRWVWVSAAVCLTACGTGSSGDDDGSSSSSQSSGTQSSGTQSSGTQGGGAAASSGSEGAGAGTSGSGASQSANLYVEPNAIVGGPCAASPTAVSPPCSGAPEQQYCRLSDTSDVIMAACLGYGLDQCELMDDCEPGWHACTATDYVARGGRDVVPDLSSATNRAWLAACAQDQGDSRFRNEACSYCGDTTFEPVVEWWCDGEVVYEGGMAGTTLGVLTQPECMRVGENLSANGAHWGMGFTTTGPSFVMCCLDAL
jgi:hypothetical protein